ncbi:MAG: hypothetical protein HY841_11655 [Bacteroidetes bacterium]|nr:hypothetical protein [Bacteroidota bacterium]
MISKYIDNCDQCHGSGTVTYKEKCSNCEGRGNIPYPKSQLPRVTNRVDWSGWVVEIQTKPAGATINSVSPKSGQYIYAGISNKSINWYSSNTSSSESFPIILEYQGKKYKVLPYDTKGNPSSLIKVNFLSAGSPTVKGGKFIN